jgi:ABC-2 type transport system permease protein
MRTSSRRFNRHRLRAIAWKECLQLGRDGRSLALAFVLPVILLVLFGSAITTDVKDIRMAVLDRDHTVASRALIDAFGQSGYFSIRRVMTRAEEAAGLIDRNVVRAVLVIPERFAADLNSGRSAPVELIVDGSDAKTATVAIGYADAITGTYSGNIQLASRRAIPAVQAESRVWYNETLDGRAMIVPGLIALIMSIIAAMLTSLTIAREWERGTMEQLAATPVGRAEVIFGKLLPYLGIALVDVAVALVFCVYLFDVPFRGSLILFGLASFIFLVGVLGLGILISAVLKSQVLATQAAISATYLPTLLLSGFFFAVGSMPVLLQTISRLIPARYYVSITRAVFLRGTGFEVLWPTLLGLTLYATFVIGMSIRSFRKELA